MLTVHHLGHSQSDRIVWLCEELGLTYTLQKHDRSPLLSPPEIKALHPIGAAPVITDDTPHGSITLAETAACLEYILHVHGGTAGIAKLTIPPGNANYAEYLYWLHFANGTLQPTTGMNLMMMAVGADSGDGGRAARVRQKHEACLALMDARVKDTGAWLAGEQFTVADVMSVFSLTGMREFYPFDLGGYPNLLAYLQRVVKRDGYRRAMQKGDPDIEVETLVGAQPPPMFKGMRQ